MIPPNSLQPPQVRPPQPPPPQIMPVPMPGRDTFNKAATWKRNETTPYTKGMIPQTPPFFKPPGIPLRVDLPSNKPRDERNESDTTQITRTEIFGEETNRRKQDSSNLSPPLNGASSGRQSSANIDVPYAAKRQSIASIDSSSSEGDAADRYSSVRSKSSVAAEGASYNSETLQVQNLYKPLGPPPPNALMPIPPPPPSSPMQSFGKLKIKCIQGMDLKAGQGVFGKADPYVKLKIGNQEMVSDPDAQGGKKPVSFYPFARHHGDDYHCAQPIHV